MKSAIAVSALLFASLSAHSGTEALKGKREVLIDNDKVEVVRLTYPPGTESGMHTHQYPSRVVYVVKGGEIQLVPADTSKKAKTLKVKDGMSLYMPKNSHNVRNVGDTEVVLVETEIK